MNGFNGFILSNNINKCSMQFQLNILANTTCFQLPRARHVFLLTRALSVNMGTTTVNDYRSELARCHYTSKIISD